jgi:hypothetical protein
LFFAFFMQTSLVALVAQQCMVCHRVLLVPMSMIVELTWPTRRFAML